MTSGNNITLKWWIPHIILTFFGPFSTYRDSGACFKGNQSRLSNKLLHIWSKMHRWIAVGATDASSCEVGVEQGSPPLAPAKVDSDAPWMWNKCLSYLRSLRRAPAANQPGKPPVPAQIVSSLVPSPPWMPNFINTLWCGQQFFKLKLKREKKILHFICHFVQYGLGLGLARNCNVWCIPSDTGRRWDAAMKEAGEGEGLQRVRTQSAACLNSR